MLGKVVDGNCVGGLRCALLRALGSDFQACSFNHSDISPLRVNDMRAVRDQIIANPLRLPSVSRSRFDPAASERASATSPLEFSALRQSRGSASTPLSS